jgi:hypothetical protein
MRWRVEEQKYGRKPERADKCPRGQSLLPDKVSVYEPTSAVESPALEFEKLDARTGYPQNAKFVSLVAKFSHWSPTDTSVHTFKKFLFGVHFNTAGSQEHSVGMVTKLWARRLGNSGSIFGTGERFSSSPHRPYRKYGPSNFLYSGYQTLLHPE